MSGASPANVQVDRRHDRRELKGEELRLLLSATRATKRTFRSLTGWDRVHLYATARETGFRATGLASLTPERIALDTEIPAVALSARGKVESTIPDRIRTCSLRLRRRSGDSCRRAEKALVFLHFTHLLSYLQACANICGRVRKTAEFPQVRERCAEDSAQG